jgi:hypothetical protein
LKADLPPVGLDAGFDRIHLPTSSVIGVQAGR